MFDLNLLSEPGIQSAEMVDCSISFIKEKLADSPNTTPIVKNKKATKKPMVLPSLSLYAIIFMAIAGVIFYPMVSNLNFNMPMQSKKISQEKIL